MDAPPDLAGVEEILGHRFRDRELLRTALSHASTRSPDRQCNERLEFLGDSVVGLVIAARVHERFPEEDEGHLTWLKSQVVSEAALSQACRELGLEPFLRVDKGVIRQRRELPPSILADAFEAVAGALYLDRGLAVAEAVILQALDPLIDQVLEGAATPNHKAILQEHAQRTLGLNPTYVILRAAGPDHDRRFLVAARLGDRQMGMGRGTTRKAAEQEAARRTLAQLATADAEDGA
jgi:ribonuclease-3